MTRLSGKLILVLEDEPLIMFMLEDIIAEAGATTVSAKTCPDALDFLQSVLPQAAVLDFRIRDGDCREVASKLKDLQIPFILASGEIDDNALGAAALVRKPYTFETLTEALAWAIEPEGRPGP